MTETQPEMPPEVPPEVPRTSLLDDLGERADRRMTPRLGIALAGSGAFIAVAGAIGIGGDRLTNDDGDIQRIPGVLVSLALIAAGMFVLQRIRTGPIATAASVGAASGVPLLIFFVTVDDDGFPPFSFDALLLLSTLAWGAAYLVGPARGRMLFLALALVAAPVFVIEQVEEISQVPEAMGESIGNAFFGGGSDPYVYDDEGNIVLDDDGFPVFDEEFADEAEPPDFPEPTNIGVILLAFGAVYAIGSHLLARRGMLGTATPPAVLGAILLPLAVAFLSDDVQEIGGGLLLVVFGLATVGIGVASARRFTSWFGSGVFALGVLILVGEAIGDDASAMTSSVVALLTGLAVVLVAHLVTTAIGEPAEEDERRSFRPGTRQGPGTGPAPEDVDRV